nr:malonyl-coenzyme A:anthocyanin 3-O-glucoside-6''-O-malonyltransferase-like [Tanacetum cinerariifolium]
MVFRPRRQTKDLGYLLDVTTLDKIGKGKVREHLGCLADWQRYRRTTRVTGATPATTTDRCAYVWTCIAKSRVHVEGKKGEYEVERFLCSMDLRSRLDPPVPQTYFGNCVWRAAAQTQTTILTGDRGFPTAVKQLAKAIRERESNKKGMFEDAEILFDKGFPPFPTIGVAGTPKFIVYNVDFGWGKPKKYEVISLDYNNSISVNASNDSPEELEIGLCLPPEQMDAFLTISRNE